MMIEEKNFFKTHKHGNYNITLVTEYVTKTNNFKINFYFVQ